MATKALFFAWFCKVSLSSLNRHAVATREDVGMSKALCLKKHFLRIFPECQVDAQVLLYDSSTEEKILSGNPDFVLDCIDNIDTKVISSCHITNKMSRTVPFHARQLCCHILLCTNRLVRQLRQKKEYINDEDELPSISSNYDKLQFFRIYKTEKQLVVYPHYLSSNLYMPFRKL